MAVRFYKVSNKNLGNFSVQINFKTENPQKVAEDIIEDEIYNLEPSQLFVFNYVDDKNTEVKEQELIGMVSFKHRGHVYEVDIEPTSINEPDKARSLAKQYLLQQYKNGLPEKATPLSHILKVYDKDINLFD